MKQVNGRKEILAFHAHLGADLLLVSAKSMGNAGAELSLFLDGQESDLLAVGAAGRCRAFTTRFTLNKEQIAHGVFAVYITVAFTVALVTLREDIIGNPFSDALIEDKVFSNKTREKPLLLHLVGVLNDPSVQLVDVVEAIVLEVSAGFLAANAPGAIEQDLLVFFALEEIFHHGEFFSEGVGVRTNGSFEATDSALIVIAHVDHDRIVIFECLMKFFGTEVLADIGHVVFIFFETIGDDLLADLHLEFPKGQIFFYGHFEGYPMKLWNRVELIDKVLPLGLWDADLSVDAFTSDIHPPEDSKCFPGFIELISEHMRLLNTDISVERYCLALKWLLSDFFQSLLLVELVVEDFHSVEGNKLILSEDRPPTSDFQLKSC